MKKQITKVYSKGQLAYELKNGQWVQKSISIGALTYGVDNLPLNLDNVRESSYHELEDY
jgi:hypothetical protein